MIRWVAVALLVLGLLAPVEAADSPTKEQITRMKGKIESTLGNPNFSFWKDKFKRAGLDLVMLKVIPTVGDPATVSDNTDDYPVSTKIIVAGQLKNQRLLIVYNQMVAAIVRVDRAKERIIKVTEIYRTEPNEVYHGYSELADSI